MSNGYPLVFSPTASSQYQQRKFLLAGGEQQAPMMLSTRGNIRFSSQRPKRIIACAVDACNQAFGRNPGDARNHKRCPANRPSPEGAAASPAKGEALGEDSRPVPFCSAQRANRFALARDKRLGRWPGRRWERGSCFQGSALRWSTGRPFRARTGPGRPQAGATVAPSVSGSGVVISSKNHAVR